MTSSFRAKTAELIGIARFALLLYVILHIALLTFDVHEPDAFLRGDRAVSRLAVVEQAQQAGVSGLGHLFLATGLPGDYVIFLPFYTPFGQYGVILAQLMAGLATLLISVGLARTLGASDRVAAGAGVLYCLLPGAVMDPHLLVTETFFTTAFAAGLWALAQAARAGCRRDVWLGMGLLTVAAFIRPQALPFGLIAAVPLLLGASRLRRDAVLAPLLCLLVFPGIWLLWRYLQVGEFGLGPSMFDIGTNLKIRADRMALIANIPGEMLSAPGDPGRLTPQAFVELARLYPHALVTSFTSDWVNLVANPGANALFGQYLQYYPPMPDVAFWKHAIDSGGVPGVVRAVFESSGRLVFSMLLTGVIHVVAVAGALAGLWRVLRERRLRLAASVVTLVCLAESAVVFVSGLVRWAHRAPLEPVIAALAAIGVAWLLGRIRRRRVPIAT